MFEFITTYQLKRLAREAKPDTMFMRDLERRFVQRDVSILLSWRMKTATIVASVCSCLLVTTSVYAYTSDNVLPDNPLYPLRESLEETETILAVTPQARVNVQLKQARRRLREASLILEKKKKLSPKATQRFEAKIESAILNVDKLPSKKADQIREQVIELRVTYARLLSTTRSQATTTREQRQQDRINMVSPTSSPELQERLRGLSPFRRR